MRVCYAGGVDLAAHEDVSGFVAEGAGFAVGFGGVGVGLGHFFSVFLLFFFLKLLWSGDFYSLSFSGF